MRKIKVFCGRPTGSFKVACACYSLKNYCDITGFSYSWARDYACETHNEEDVKLALETPFRPVKIERDI